MRPSLPAARAARMSAALSILASSAECSAISRSQAATALDRVAIAVGSVADRADGRADEVDPALPDRLDQPLRVGTKRPASRLVEAVDPALRVDVEARSASRGRGGVSCACAVRGQRPGECRSRRR